jgi:hypothetical protein
MSNLNNEFDFFEMIHIHLRTIIIIYKIICIKIIYLLIKFFLKKIK